MTMLHKALLAMRDRETFGVQDVQEALGWNYQQAKDCLKYLANTDMVERLQRGCAAHPASYRITASGLDRAAGRPRKAYTRLEGGQKAPLPTFSGANSVFALGAAGGGQ